MTHAIRKISLTITGIAFLFLALFAQSPKTIVGKWKSVEEAGKVMEFFQQKDGSYASRRLNDLNTEPTTETLILKDLRFDDQSKSFIGTMSPPDSKLELNATVQFVENNRIEVKTSKLFIKKTIHLIRIK